MLNPSRQNWSLCLGKRRRNGSVAACKTNHPAVQYTIWHLPLWDGKGGGGSYLHCWSAIFILSCDSSRDNQITYSWHSYRYVFMMSVTTMKKIDDDPVQCPTLRPPRNAGAANLRYPSALQQHFLTHYTIFIFLTWKGSWFWLFTHFGAIKSPRRTL